MTKRCINVIRAATAWLIRRFIDPDAQLVFVEPHEVAELQDPEGPKGFDAPGATYPHQDTPRRAGEGEVTRPDDFS